MSQNRYRLPDDDRPGCALGLVILLTLLALVVAFVALGAILIFGGVTHS